MKQLFFQNSLMGQVCSVGGKFSQSQVLQAEINCLDREIDALVYEWYGLREEEIRIVEGGEG